jgi:hypothetical protein
LLTGGLRNSSKTNLSNKIAELAAIAENIFCGISVYASPPYNGGGDTKCVWGDTIFNKRITIRQEGTMFTKFLNIFTCAAIIACDAGAVAKPLKVKGGVMNNTS